MLRSPNVEHKNVHVQQMVYPENTAAVTEQQVQCSIRIFRTYGDLRIIPPNTFWTNKYYVIINTNIILYYYHIINISFQKPNPVITVEIQVFATFSN